MLYSAEVIEVILKDNDQNYPGYYTIRFKFLTGATSNNEDTKTAIPLNAHVKSIPVPGEIVLIVSAASSFAGNLRTESTFYYMNDVNIQSSINYNGVPTAGSVPSTNNSSYQNASLGVTSAPNQSQPSRTKKTFEIVNNVKPLQLFEGDIVIEGRGGNSIRLSSTIKNSNEITKQPTWLPTKTGDPIMIISNTKPNSAITNSFRIEDINKDDSSIYLTSTQKIGIILANRSLENNVSNYTSPQIIFNSSRIILNSKVDNIIMSSKKDIYFSTNQSKTSVNLIVEALEILARGTFPTSVGPTGPHPQLVEILKKLRNI